MSNSVIHRAFGPFFSGGNLVTTPKVYHYYAGTTTEKYAWSDHDQSSRVAQPLVGDAEGLAAAFFQGFYKIVVKDASNNTLYTWDEWGADTSGLSVVLYGAVGNGVTSDQIAVAGAIADAYSTGQDLYWPAGTYLTTATIPNFHDVRHWGPGVAKRGSDLWAVQPHRTTIRTIYVAATGTDVNDGLSSSQPRLTIQGVVDILHEWGPIVGRQKVSLAAGTYGETVRIPNGLAMNDNYLEFNGPSGAGVRGTPTAILDGTGFVANGLTIESFNNVYCSYIMFQNWYDTGASVTDQVVNAVVAYEFSTVYLYGCSGTGNGYSHMSLQPLANGIVTGGIYSGARLGLNNTGGNLSLTSSGADYTTIKLAEEYGIHTKHQGSTVLDFTEFLDNGLNAAAASYGAALIAYKHNASVDTRECVFKRNNIVYNVRGGTISPHPSLADTIGTGADANVRLWLIRGFGENDLMNYRSAAGREISLSFGGNSTTSAVNAVIFDTNAVIPAGYLIDTDQHVEIEIFATNAAGGTAQVRPSFVSGAAARYELGNFQIAAATNAHLRLVVQTSSDGTIATVWYATQGATIGGVTSGVATINPVVFDSDTMEFQVWGETSAGNSLAIRKTRVVLWG